MSAAPPVRGIPRETVFGCLVLVYLCVSIVAYSDYPRESAVPVLTDLERGGLDVWRSRNCQACHQLYGFGGFLGPDLTNLIDDETADEEYWSLFTDGSKQMPAFHLPASDQEAVLAFLRAVNRTGRSQVPALGSARPVPGFDHLRILAEEWQRGAQGTLDPAVERGCALWTQARCGACHAAFTTGRKRAPDLSARARDRSVAKLRALLAGGRRNMPSFTMRTEEVEDLGAFLSWVSDRRAELVELNDRLLGRERFAWTALPWFEFR